MIERLVAAPVGTLTPWNLLLVPTDWIRCRRQPVVEYPCLELIIEVCDTELLVGVGFELTPAGWVLPNRPGYIMRVRP